MTFVVALMLLLSSVAEAGYSSAMSATVGKFIIYCLHHDSSPRVYVGKSSRGMQRTREHGHPARLEKTPHLPVAQWVQKRLRLGQKYSVAILEECSSFEDLDEAERFHIAYLRSVGVQLLNCTDGGESVGPNRSVIEANRSRKGEKRSPETCAKLSEIAFKRESPSAETRKKLSIASSNRSPEWRAETSRRMTGKKQTPEHIANVAKAHIGIGLGLKHSPERVEKNRLSHLGQKKSPESKEKNRIASTGRRQTPQSIAKTKMTKTANRLQRNLQLPPRFRVNLLKESV